MTSTTSAFIPAAARAGTPAYSPDTSASLAAADDSADTPSFDELCPEERGRSEAESSAATASSEEPAAEATDTEVATDAADSCEESGGADDTEQQEDDEEGDDRTHAGPALEAPTIVQSLLVNLREIAPAAANVAPGSAPAENAGQATTNSKPTASLPQDSRPATSADAETALAASTLAVRRQGRAHAGREGQGNTPASPQRESTAVSANARLTDKAAATGETPASGFVRGKGGSVEDPSAQVAVGRVPTAKGHAEKTAGQAAAAQVLQAASGQNKFLHADNQDVVSSTRIAGTRSAISAGTMSSSTTSASQRRAGSPTLEVASPTAPGQGAWTETLSVDWKGWTNGGGERSSTAAQFSQLGDKLSHLGAAATPAAATIARGATPAATFAAPTTPTVPAEAAEALAPIHSAIERLVLHGRDQLALTVRFEQGGSLSIRLAMNQGEIATQIQTDVPGLEAALKSAWGDLAQDWNSRGWKLGQPEFASSPATYHSREDTTADGRSPGRQARQNADETPDFGGRAFSPARLKHAGAVALSGLDALRAAALARRGIHTWA